MRAKCKALQELLRLLRAHLKGLFTSQSKESHDGVCRISKCFSLVEMPHAHTFNGLYDDMIVIKYVKLQYVKGTIVT